MATGSKAGLAKVRLGILFALVPGLLGLALLNWPITAGLERTYGLDLLFKLRGTQTPPEDVCVVAIDDASFIELGLDALEPWPRSLHGQLIQISQMLFTI